MVNKQLLLRIFKGSYYIRDIYMLSTSYLRNKYLKQHTQLLPGFNKTTRQTRGKPFRFAAWFFAGGKPLYLCVEWGSDGNAITWRLASQAGLQTLSAGCCA